MDSIVHMATENVVLAFFLVYLLLMVPVIGAKDANDSAKGGHPPK